jgi:colanic acid biosynthesis glycosyl transferase WcaI
MRLLIICINYAPEIISTGVYTTGLAEWMAGEGVETDVVTAQPYYPAWRVFEGWRHPWWINRISENGVRITHCPIYVPQNPTGLKRILHYVTFALSAFPVAICKSLRRRPDVVLLVAPSMIAAPVAMVAACLARGSAWLHIQDYEVEAAFATHLLKEKSLAGKLAKRFETWVLHRFDRVSSISPPMLAKLAEKKVSENRTYELRNWANLRKVNPIPEGSSPLKHEFGILTKYVALYSGNLANKQGIEILPEMAQHLSHRDDLTIAICGDGPMRQTLEEMSKDIPSIQFFPLQPIEKLSDLLGMADVHLLPQIAGAADLVLPSKLTNMLASGRPVVATTPIDSALGNEVRGVGRVTTPGDAIEMAQAVDKLLNSPEERRLLGKKARERALERWDMDAILTRAKRELEKLSSEKAGAVKSPKRAKDRK